MQTLIYRLRYWHRVICHALGFCPRCFTMVNFTRSGKACCPKCGK
jgi:hypothetical protein